MMETRRHSTAATRPENEPDCEGGVCQSVCGDGVILPGTSEVCDDGNTNDGDGCSSGCQEEEGFACVLSPVDLGDELSIPVIYRDFRSNDTADPLPTTFSLDFNNPDDSNGGIAFDITADRSMPRASPGSQEKNPTSTAPTRVRPTAPLR